MFDFKNTWFIMWINVANNVWFWFSCISVKRGTGSIICLIRSTIKFCINLDIFSRSIKFSFLVSDLLYVGGILSTKTDFTVSWKQWRKPRSETSKNQYTSWKISPNLKKVWEKRLFNNFPYKDRRNDWVCCVLLLRMLA